MSVGVISFKKNTALVVFIIIDVMFLVWSCESEPVKVAKQLNEKNKKEIVRAPNSQDELS